MFWYKETLDAFEKLAFPPDIVVPLPLFQLLSVAKSPLVTFSGPYSGTGFIEYTLPSFPAPP